MKNFCFKKGRLLKESISTFLIVTLFACIISVFTFFKSPKKHTANSTPNIILIVADDHGSDALGCYGNVVIKTPNLDKLAAEGTRFTNAFCTAASCSPSRSVILSGVQNHSNGMYGLQHSYHHFTSFDNIKSLPVLLAENGYRTGRVGKFHVAPEEVYKFQNILSGGGANDPGSLGRNASAMAEISKQFITEENDKPFFLYFATDDPHRSNAILPNGEPDFNAPGPNLFGNRKQGYQGVTKEMFDPMKVIVPPFLPNTKECREEIAQYYQAVSRVDQGIGKLIQILKESGRYDNTVIIYISDNGMAFPGAKTTLYDAGMRLPCIVRNPAQSKKSIVSQAMISWVDITPTILDFAGISTTKEKFQGRSFKGILTENNSQGWDEVYASHSLHEITMYYPMRVIRTRKYKLIYNIAHQLQFPMALDLQQSYTWKSIVQNKIPVYGKRKVNDFLHRPKFELYDLENDPDEIKNLAADSRYKQVYDELLAKLKHFQEKTNDPWFHKWQYE